jgi:hypothetical protein
MPLYYHYNYADVIRGIGADPTGRYPVPRSPVYRNGSAAYFGLPLTNIGTTATGWQREPVALLQCLGRDIRDTEAIKAVLTLAFDTTSRQLDRLHNSLWILRGTAGSFIALGAYLRTYSYLEEGQWTTPK